MVSCRHESTHCTEHRAQGHDDAARPRGLRDAASYRAAVVHAFHEPLSLDDVPAVKLAAGEVRVEVEASGLCHTRVALIDRGPRLRSPRASSSTSARRASSSFGSPSIADGGPAPGAASTINSNQIGLVELGQPLANGHLRQLARTRRRSDRSRPNVRASDAAKRRR
jgi:hypothetical protein